MGLLEFVGHCVQLCIPILCLYVSMGQELQSAPVYPPPHVQTVFPRSPVVIFAGHFVHDSTPMFALKNPILQFAQNKTPSWYWPGGHVKNGDGTHESSAAIV